MSSKGARGLSVGPILPGCSLVVLFIMSIILATGGIWLQCSLVGNYPTMDVSTLEPLLNSCRQSILIPMSVTFMAALDTLYILRARSWPVDMNQRQV